MSARARAIVRRIQEPETPGVMSLHCVVKRGRKIICEIVTWPHDKLELATDMRDSAKAFLDWLDSNNK